MADDTLNSVGAKLVPDGAASAPDLNAQVDAIGAQYDPQIEKEQGVAQDYEAKSVAAEQQTADLAEKQANDDGSDKEIAHWLTQTPTREAAYSTNMHAAPVLAILTAIGGSVTRLNGQQMLAATNGIVQGLNESSEEKYDSAWKAWQASYQAMRDHQQQLTRARQLMLTAYQGRADAYQRAGEAARRMTGDLLSAEQKQKMATIDTFKAQDAAMARLARINETHRMNDEHIRKDLAMESRWKQTQAASAKLPAGTKALIAAEQQSYKNAKDQATLAKAQLGQLNTNLTMGDEERQARTKQLQDALQFQELQMDSATQRGAALAAGAAAQPGVTPPKPGANSAAPNPNSTAAPSAGGGNASPALNDKRKTYLQQHQGKVVTFPDGSQWVMRTSGQVEMISPPKSPTPTVH